MVGWIGVVGREEFVWCRGGRGVGSRLSLEDVMKDGEGNSLEDDVPCLLACRCASGDADGEYVWVGFIGSSP